jgi:hypothetical protein
MTLKNIDQRCKLVNVRHTGQQWGRPSVRNDAAGKSER